MNRRFSTVILLVATCCRPASAPGAPLADHVPLKAALKAVSASELCVGAGRGRAQADGRVHVDAGGMRAVVAGDHSAAAEIAFTYRGPSTSASPLANGELRRQIGLKLRAQDTCNVVYVMWHIEPSPGVFVSVKRNRGSTKHRECGAGGYDNVKAQVRETAPVITRDAPHVLRAELEGEDLRVTADDVLVWRGRLPAQAFAFDGPVGLRTDNGVFDLQLRVPGGAVTGATCSGGLSDVRLTL